MVVPLGAKSFGEAVRMGSEIYMELKKVLKDRYGPVAINVGDEGGFAPPLRNSFDAFNCINESIVGAGYDENDVKMAIDTAASSIFSEGSYSIDEEHLSAEELLELYIRIADEFPIVSIEDPFNEDDFMSFQELTKSIGKRVQIVGDDIFVTNKKRLQKGVEMSAANSVLLKVNQIGSLTEAADVAKYAMAKNFTVVVSHRSGETEDNYISDLAVALGSGQIKAGAPARGERISKYNQLLRIEQLLGTKARYAGAAAFKRR
jgi:enolase